MATALHDQPAAAETIPPKIREAYQLIDRWSALREIHFPSDWESMRRAKRRIVFEELFLFAVRAGVFCAIRERPTDGASFMFRMGEP